MKRLNIALLIFSGILLISVSTLLAFLDVGNGDTSSSGGKLSLIYILISYFGAFLLINLKVKLRETALTYALLYPVLLFLTLYMYSRVYLFPKIDREGIIIKGIVTGKEKRVSGDAVLKMSASYEFTVNKKKYSKHAFDENLNVGDTILIKYLKSNPNFHKYYMP